jgi:hypothetical protein
MDTKISKSQTRQKQRQTTNTEMQTCPKGPIKPKPPNRQRSLNEEAAELVLEHVTHFNRSRRNSRRTHMWLPQVEVVMRKITLLLARFHSVLRGEPADVAVPMDGSKVDVMARTRQRWIGSKNSRKGKWDKAQPRSPPRPCIRVPNTTRDQITSRTLLPHIRIPRTRGQVTAFRYHGGSRMLYRRRYYLRIILIPKTSRLMELYSIPVPKRAYQALACRRFPLRLRRSAPFPHILGWVYFLVLDAVDEASGTTDSSLTHKEDKRTKTTRYGRPYRSNTKRLNES